jgi:hypothetical protein
MDATCPTGQSKISDLIDAKITGVQRKVQGPVAHNALFDFCEHAQGYAKAWTCTSKDMQKQGHV